jgi:hypothetical protein
MLHPLGGEEQRVVVDVEALVRLDVELDAFDGDALVYERHFETTVPRDLG